MGATQTTPNVNQQTIPMFSPDGKLGDVPVTQINAARAKGAKPAVQIKSPDGADTGWVPSDRLQDAISKGGKLVPIEQQETQHPGFWHSVIQDVAGTAKGLATVGAAGFGDRGAAADLSQSIVQSVANAPAENAQRKAAGYSAPYRAIAPVAEAVGVNVPGMEEAAKEGDAAGVAGHTVVPAAAAVAPLAGEAAIRGAGAVLDAAKESPAIQAGTAAAKAAAKKLPAAAVRRIPYVGDVAADVYQAASDAAKNAKANTTVATGAEDFREPGTSSQTESAATSEEQEPPETSTPAPAPKPDTSPAAIQAKLNDALGGKPLQKNVSLKNQVSAKAASSAASNLPEGFTPVDSSAIKGYKYDPQAQELTTISTNGQQYTHAEVSPDEFKAFQDADSKGKAWNTIRQNHVLTQKNGRPTIPSGPRTVVTDPETGAPEFSDVVATRQNGGQATAPTPAKAPAADEDLTNLLQQSLDQVKGKQQTTKTDLGQLAVTPQGKGAVIPPGGVMTLEDPADLAERWGVDEKSLIRGREQTRGMTPAQTEQATQKLTEAYKKGFAVKPLMETQDEFGNITDVDGRQRAIAAKRAGVKRIPVIVRRIRTVQ